MPGNPGLNDRSPEELSERGRNAAKARTSTDYLIRSLVDRPLSEVQRAQLIAMLLVPTPQDTA